MVILVIINNIEKVLMHKDTKLSKQNISKFKQHIQLKSQKQSLKIIIRKNIATNIIIIIQPIPTNEISSYLHGLIWPLLTVLTLNYIILYIFLELSSSIISVALHVPRD